MILSIFSEVKLETSASIKATIFPWEYLNPVLIAEPLPSFIMWLITVAPAFSASSTVLSVDPSSTTITSSTYDSLRATLTTLATVASSLNAGITMETDLSEPLVVLIEASKNTKITTSQDTFSPL